LLKANPRRIDDRLVWTVGSNDLTHWATWAPTTSEHRYGHHEIAEILLKVALNTKNKNKNQWRVCTDYTFYLSFIYNIILVDFHN
jgi:hypothetical protein